MSFCKRQLYLLLATLCFLATACKKDCKVAPADFSPTFLYHDGMAPEGVLLEPRHNEANEYSWNVQGFTSDQYRDTVDFDASGDFDVTLTTSKGKHECQETLTITIRDYPYLNSDRALSFFESNGTNVRLIAKVIDFPDAGNYVAISYEVGLPEAGGGMDYDNGRQKLFAAPLALLASCYPNNADLQFPVPPDEQSDRVFFDTALDPGDGFAYLSGTENGNMFIRSTEAYGTTGVMTDVVTGPVQSDFVYLTFDRVNNVLYWTNKGGNSIFKLENGNTVVALVGNAFFDLDFDDSNGLLYFVENENGINYIKRFDPNTGEVLEDAGPIVGEVSFLYIDEDTQEVFWVNNTDREILGKRITFPVSAATVHASNLGEVRGMAVGNFVED